MRSIRSIFVPLLSFAVFAAPACDSRVHLGAIGTGTANVLWSSTFEPGDLSEWLGDDEGGTFVENSSVGPTVTTDVVHAGHYAGKSTVVPMGMTSTCYFFRNQPSRTEAFYSAWFYIPSASTVRGYLSLIHLRSSPTNDGMNVVAMWDFNIIPDPGVPGALTSQLYNFATQVNFGQLTPSTPVVVPTDRWIHFEFLLVKATDATGRISIWQDDVNIIDAQNIITAETDWVQWDVGAASNNMDPVPAAIYMDDAAISLSRLGSGNAAGDHVAP
ncbi:MAG TPA: heparin lyase I family protein [Polyangia bacterium]|jgi:hypothetical protein